MKFCPKCKTENKEQNKFCIKCGTMLPSSSIILDHLHTVILIFGIFGIISVMSAITGLNILFGKSIVHESDRITGIYFLIPIVVTFVIGYIIFKSTIKEQNLLPKPAIPLEQKATNLLKVESFMLLLSPITGGFRFGLISMLDSMILLQSIAFTTLVCIDPNDKRSEKWLYIGIVTYIGGVFAMVVALGYSGIAGWR